MCIYLCICDYQQTVLKPRSAAKSFNPTLPLPRHKFPRLSTNRRRRPTLQSCAAQLWLLQSGRQPRLTNDIWKYYWRGRGRGKKSEMPKTSRVRDAENVAPIEDQRPKSRHKTRRDQNEKINKRHAIEFSDGRLVSKVWPGV